MIAAPRKVPDVLIQEQQSSGTNGGTFTSGAYHRRVLNTIVRNTIGASLADNQVTLPAGTYFAKWCCPAGQVGAHKTRLFNATDKTVIAHGSSARGIGDSAGTACFTLKSSKAIEIGHRSSASQIKAGFGLACSFGDVEIYSELIIWKQ